MFDNVERVLATLAGLCVFTLNDLRLFNDGAREAAAGLQLAHIHIGGGPEAVYLSALDLASRWGLAGVTVALGAWAIAETLQRPVTDDQL